ncbi:uncharacterized protein [Rutidosis leptorrhynchoides]|uniref:uncharacterized protein n=1 Tax=Rutidosis leptorrhynchoides TaxID=125765 RepID=UPI003A9979A2
MDISKYKAYRALQAAKKVVQGDYAKQYDYLRDYLEELSRSNPGTTVRLLTEPCDDDVDKRKFMRCYVCLGPLKEGFRTLSRDLLGLDGAFMKEPATGQILSDVGVDSNNGIYSLAYAILEGENYNSWSWFLECLRDDLDLTSMSNFTFISDRQKGLIHAVERIFPCVEHGFCLRHLHENMKTKNFRGLAYKQHLWNMRANDPKVPRPELWVNQVHHRKRWFDTYQHAIIPLNGRDMWPKSNVTIPILPPKKIATAGRPKKSRRKGLLENDNIVEGGKL